MKLTIREIAELSGVSITTVSQILNKKSDRFSEETVKRVLKVVEENQYTPNYFASNIIKKESKLIGVIVPFITEQFSATLINLIRKSLSEEGYYLMVSESSGEMKEEIELFNRYHQIAVEAILCFTSNRFSEDVVVSSAYRNIPIVFVDAGINNSHFGNVYYNEYETVTQAIEWLIQNNHEKIGLITDDGSGYSFIERSNAYFDAMKNNKKEIYPHLVVKTDFSVENGYQATKTILKDEEVTAIFCCDDNLALGCYQAVYDSGKKVNDEIVVIGFDGIELLKSIRPQIQTLEIPFHEYAEILSKKLIKAMAVPHQKQEDDYLKMKFIEKKERTI